LVFKDQFSNPYKKDAEEVKKERQKNNDENLIAFYKDPNNLKTFFENFPRATTMDKIPYEKDLDFIAVASPYLISFYRLLGELVAINDQINQRNNFTNYMKIADFQKAEWTSGDINRVVLVIAQHSSSAKNLDMLINSALAYSMLCKKYLNDYAAKFLPEKKLQDFILETKHEDELINDYHKDFDTLIQKAVQGIVVLLKKEKWYSKLF